MLGPFLRVLHVLRLRLPIHPVFTRLRMSLKHQAVKGGSIHPPVEGSGQPRHPWLSHPENRRTYVGNSKVNGLEEKDVVHTPIRTTFTCDQYAHQVAMAALLNANNFKKFHFKHKDYSFSPVFCCSSRRSVCRSRSPSWGPCPGGPGRPRPCPPGGGWPWPSSRSPPLRPGPWESWRLARSRSEMRHPFLHSPINLSLTC